MLLAVLLIACCGTRRRFPSFLGGPRNAGALPAMSLSRKRGASPEPIAPLVPKQPAVPPTKMLLTIIPAA
jgi:hypothetical protein